MSQDTLEWPSPCELCAGDRVHTQPKPSRLQWAPGVRQTSPPHDVSGCFCCFVRWLLCTRGFPERAGRLNARLHSDMFVPSQARPASATQPCTFGPPGPILCTAGCRVSVPPRPYCRTGRGVGIRDRATAGYPQGIARPYLQGAPAAYPRRGRSHLTDRTRSPTGPGGSPPRTPVYPPVDEGCASSPGTRRPRARSWGRGLPERPASDPEASDLRRRRHRPLTARGPT
jgi:hypothetical protein